MVFPEESSSPNTNKYFGIIYFFAVLVPCYFLLALYFYRRNIQPIKGRLPVLSCLAQLCILFHQTYLVALLLWSSSLYCSVGNMILFLTLLPAVDFYLARGYILYFIFHVTQERLAMASEKITHERQASRFIEGTQPKDASRETTLKWFLRNRYRVQRPFLSACLVSAVLLQSIYPVVYTIQNASRRSPDNTPRDCGFVEFSGVLGIEVGVLILVAIWIAVKLRHIKDGFFLKDELRLISALGAIGVVGWLTMTNFSAVHYFSVDVFDVITLFLFLIEIAVFFLTTIYPLWRSYDPMFHSVEDEKTDQDLKQLQQTIDTVPGFESFRAFLTREFSVQNLLFYCDVRDFRSKYNPNTMDPISNTKSPTSANIPVVTASPLIAFVVSAQAPPSLAGSAPSSPVSTPRAQSIPMAPASPHSHSIPTRSSLMTSSLIRTSSNASNMGIMRSTSTVAPKETFVFNNVPTSTSGSGKQEKEKEGIQMTPQMTTQQLAEHNKKLLLTEANIQYDAQRLFRKYVAFGAPLQVNLPDHAVATLAASLGLNRDGTRARRPRERDIPANSSFISNTSSASKYHSSTTAPVPLRSAHSSNHGGLAIDIDTSNAINFLMFDEAQQIISRLMAVDSFKRYKKSSDYQELTRLIESDPILKLGLGRI